MTDEAKAKELVQNKVCEKLCPDECHKPCEAYGIFVDLVLVATAEAEKENEELKLMIAELIKE